MGLFRKKEAKQDNQKGNSFTNPVAQIFGMGGGGALTQDRTLIDGQKLINEWLSKKHLFMKTNLNQNQINSIAILYGLGKQFRIKPLLDLLNGFIMFMISKDSQSATQLVNILQSRGFIDSNELDAITKFSK
jgi:tRNA(Phe) wybutosine-synthesizing methylase Tyw3